MLMTMQGSGRTLKLLGGVSGVESYSLTYSALILRRDVISVTRLGDLLDFGNFSKSLATIYFPTSPTFLGNFYKGVKIYHFWATFINIWRHFSGHIGCHTYL